METKDEIEYYNQRAAASVFPFKMPLSQGGEFLAYGMSKRELFAALAMSGWRARPATLDREDCARLAVKDADALLAELAK